MRVQSDKQCENGGWLHRLSEPLPVVERKPKAERPVVDATHEARLMFENDSAPAMRDKLASDLGLSVRVLEYLRVGAGWDSYRGEMFSSWPQRDETGRIIGISRRYADGSKRTMQGTQGGLTYVLRLWQVGFGPLFVPEGGSDVAALVGIGASAIGRPSNSGGVALLAKMLRGCNRRIVIIGERDFKPDNRGSIPACKPDCEGCLHCWPGMAGAMLVAKQLKQRLRRAKIDWRLLESAKDSREFVNRGGILYDLLRETR